jgi:hypothetical protein
MFKRSSVTCLFFFSIDISLTVLALRLAKFLREIIPVGVYLDEPLQFRPWLYLIVPIIWGVGFAALKADSLARALRYTEDLPTRWGESPGLLTCCFGNSPASCFSISLS